MKVIELDHVSVYFHGHCVLKDISLKVEDGEFLGVIGPNGAGKTTLLKVILGLIQPASGSVKLTGDKAALKRGILGYVPQVAGFDRRFPINVLDVVLMGRLKNRFRPFSIFTGEERARACRQLERVGMLDLKKRQIGELSAGQLQKVLLARALAVEPEILLLDEPTASIDIDSRNHIYELLEELNGEMTILVVTHDLAAVSTYFDSIACLNRELFYHGEKELTPEVVEKVYGCPIELIAHGVPHRVLAYPGEDGDGESDSSGESRVTERSGEDESSRAGSGKGNSQNRTELASGRGGEHDA